LRSIVSAAQNEEKENTQQRGTNRHKEKRIVGGTLRKWGIAKFHSNSIMWPGTKYIIKGKVMASSSLSCDEFYEFVIAHDSSMHQSVSTTH